MFPSHDPQLTNISLYPEQFTLWYIGEFDDQLGLFITEKDGRQYKKEIIAGISVVQEQNVKFTIQDLRRLLTTELDNVTPMHKPVDNREGAQK